ncbi:MAG TPA: c-type cytochrome [Thermoanaerobaculia bacterium]|nr:c-type cytochrome [Thermoanaerobaculia bacterium]
MKSVPNLRAHRWIQWALMMLAMMVAAPLAAQQTIEQFFRENCVSCHTIGGGRLAGPDLKDVLQRQDRSWLKHFIRNPKQVIESGDPYAARIKEESRAVIMPTVAGLDDSRIEALLHLIERESKLEKSQFAGLTIGDQPFTTADIQAGRDIFLGKKILANGGASCVSCHDVQGLAGFGGGRLAPDLTRVYERLQGRKSLAAWLQAPATPTMRPLFATRTLTNDEIVALVAYLEDAARQPTQRPSTPEVGFVLLGLGGAVAGIALADGVWRRRFRGVRRFLVKGDR